MAEQVEVVLVTNGATVNRLRDHISACAWPKVKLIDTQNTPFNTCRYLNIGVSCAAEASLFLCDGDISICQGLFEEALPQLTATNFITIKHWEEAYPERHPHVLHQMPCLFDMAEITQFYFVDGTSATVEVSRTQLGRSVSRLMFVQRENFIKIGGCNSRLKGQEIEGFDLQVRFQKVLGLVGTKSGRAKHITHESVDRHESTAESFHDMQVCTEEYAAGNFVGTLARDFEEASPLLGEARK